MWTDCIKLSYFGGPFLFEGFWMTLEKFAILLIGMD